MQKFITPKHDLSSVIKLPGSKSYSHRYLIAAALATGPSHITNLLQAEDTDATIDVLRALGITIETLDGIVTVQGTGGEFNKQAVLNVGNSGTTARFTAALAALASYKQGGGNYQTTGSARMQQRPMAELEAALANLSTGEVTIDCSKSSQFLSALLMVAPLLPKGLVIKSTGEIVSRPYVDMTLETMQNFGVMVSEQDNVFTVNGGQQYINSNYEVEVDVSQASYFWAAAALARGEVFVADVHCNTKQGDILFLQALEMAGCTVVFECAGVRVICDKPLRAVDIGMGNAPDIVPTLAMVAAKAKGTSVLRNVAHLKLKECDRVEAIITELAKTGITAKYDNGDLYIEGGTPKGATITTYDDHRIAMSFAVLGLVAQGMVINDAEVVAKSFPNFWQVFERL